MMCHEGHYKKFVMRRKKKVRYNQKVTCPTDKRTQNRIKLTSKHPRQMESIVDLALKRSIEFCPGSLLYFRIETSL